MLDIRQKDFVQLEYGFELAALRRDDDDFTNVNVIKKLTNV